MAGLLDFYGNTPDYFSGLLGADELSRLRGQASDAGNLSTAMALLQAGAPSRTPGGGALAIAQGLQQGQQAYKQALNQGLQEKMQGLQVQEQARKMQDAARMREAFPSLFNVQTTPAVTEQNWSGAPEQIGQYFQNGTLPETVISPAQRNVSIDTNKLQALAAMSSNPLETYLSLAKAVPDLRKAGFTGSTQNQENPFSVFAQDTSVPAPLRQVATQLQKSYAAGLIDQDTADKRVSELGTRIQSAQDRELSRQDRLASQAESSSLRQMLADEKLTAAREKRDLAATSKSDAKNQLTDIVGELKKNYETLNEQGGIVSTTGSSTGNLGARLSSSAVGQAFGSAVGTKTQEERQKIEQTRPLLLNLIKTATGMSAQQMNSNAEMQLYLNAATNPKLSYEANLDALKKLDSLFGLGTVAKEIEKQQSNPAKPSGVSKSGW